VAGALNPSGARNAVDPRGGGQGAEFDQSRQRPGRPGARAAARGFNRPPLKSLDFLGTTGQNLPRSSSLNIGLSIDEAERIFQAFFTTKPRGTGMGLSISRRIIGSHGGHLWASPNTGRGATFQFTLPVEATASSPVAV
jgi:hypothetical protein